MKKIKGKYIRLTQNDLNRTIHNKLIAKLGGINEIEPMNKLKNIILKIFDHWFEIKFLNSTNRTEPECLRHTLKSLMLSQHNMPEIEDTYQFVAETFANKGQFHKQVKTIIYYHGDNAQDSNDLIEKFVSEFYHKLPTIVGYIISNDKNAWIKINDFVNEC